MVIRQVKYCNEGLKYKVFGLFPFFDINENNELVLYKGNTNVDGCYNKLSCGFKIDFDFYDGDICLLEKENTYSYTTLHHYYLIYKDRENELFIQFMNKGIGKIKVNIDIDINECDLVPFEINLSECKSLYNEMYNYKLLLDFYVESKNTVSGKYGDKFEDYFELLAYGRDENLEYWNSLDLYHEGDKVMYDDGIFVCKEKNVINCELECILDKFNRMGGDKMLEFYKNNIATADQIADELYGYANANNYYTINVNIVNTINDMGISDNYINFWDKYTYYFKGDIISYNGENYICKGKFNENGEDEGVIGDWNDVYFEDLKTVLSDDITINGITDSKLRNFRVFNDYISPLNEVETPNLTEDWLWYYKKGHVVNQSVVRDEDGNIDLLDKSKGRLDDNLMAYGDVLIDITRNNVKQQITFEYIIGCHLTAELKEIDTNEFGTYLFKYGDFAYDNKDKYSGVKYRETYNYSMDSEIYTMSDDEFNRFINNYTIKEVVSKFTPDEFNNFVNDDKNIKQINMKYIKAPFLLLSNINKHEVSVNGVEKNLMYLSSNFEVNIDKQRDFSQTPIIKQDFYSNTPFNPSVKNNVRFSRGNAAAFERHIKLGEIKSFDDFQNYANGGFFNVI